MTAAESESSRRDMQNGLILVSNGRNFDMFTALQRLASGSRLVSVHTCWHGSRASVGGVTRAWHGLNACVHVSHARAIMLTQKERDCSSITSLGASGSHMEHLQDPLLAPGNQTWRSHDTMGAPKGLLGSPESPLGVPRIRFEAS